MGGATGNIDFTMSLGCGGAVAQQPLICNAHWSLKVLWDNKTIGFTVSGELGGAAVQQKNNDLLCLERGKAVPQKDH